MTDMRDWAGKVGQVWAEEWERTDRSFGHLTDRLLATASAQPSSRVLDIGCGAGELAMAMARGHSGSWIKGIDVSPALIETAQERAGYLPNLEFEMADAASWSDKKFRPDLIISRHGVMFFDDPVAAFKNLGQGASENARLVFSCFRGLSHNNWAERIAALVPAEVRMQADRHAPGPFAFSDREYVQKVLEEAGWNDISFKAIDFAYVVGVGEDPLHDALEYFQMIGPAARPARELEGPKKARFLGGLARYLQKYSVGQILALPASAWLVSAYNENG